MGDYEEVTMQHVSHTVDDRDTFGFGSDPNAEYVQSSLFDSSIPISNGNGKTYNIGEDADEIFTSNELALPALGELQPKEGLLFVSGGDEKMLLHKIGTAENPADMMTKVVTSIKFKHCLNLINVLQI